MLPAPLASFRLGPMAFAQLLSLIASLLMRDRVHRLLLRRCAGIPLIGYLLRHAEPAYLSERLLVAVLRGEAALVSVVLLVERRRRLLRPARAWVAAAYRPAHGAAAA